MTGRERVRRAVQHQATDRVPANFEATGYVAERLLKEKGLNKYDDLLDYYQIDIAQCNPDYIGRKLKSYTDEDGRLVCETPYGCWMTAYAAGGEGEQHSVVTKYPFDEDTTVEDILKFDWINPDMFDYESVKRKCAAHPNRAMQMGHEGPFQLSTFLMNMEVLFEKMILEPEVAHALYDRFVQFELEYYERILIAGDGQIDLLRPHDDYGTQRSLLFSVPMWKEYFAENTKKLVNLAHKYGAFYHQHSCGAISEIIPSLIECGVDVLEPIQKVEGMEADRLKRDFGDKICFHGGVDTQFVLPRCTAEEVAAETARIVRTLGKGGGYILMSSQALESDVPTENIDAMFRMDLRQVD